MFMTWFMFSCNYHCLGMSQWANIWNVNSFVVKHYVGPKKRLTWIMYFWNQNIPLKATHKPHSWAAYYDILAKIWNIMGVNKFWKISQYEIFMVLWVASPYFWLFSQSDFITEFWKVVKRDRILFFEFTGIPTQIKWCHHWLDEACGISTFSRQF